MSSSNSYKVKIIREEGEDPITGSFLPYAEEIIIVYASSEKEAYNLSFTKSKIKFLGQARRVFINDNEFFNKKF